MAPWKAVARSVLIGLSAVLIIIAGGGVAFVQRPVGAAYAALWMAMWVVTAIWRKRGSPSPGREHLIILSLGGVGMLALMILIPWEYMNFDGPLERDGGLSAFGLVLFALGIMLQTAAMLKLHGGFTVYLGVRSGSKLVTTGPYRYIRHPGYTSYLMTLTGIGLGLSSLIGIALAASMVPFLLWRIKGEERMLVAEFGEEYRMYMRRTKKLIPFLY